MTQHPIIASGGHICACIHIQTYVKAVYRIYVVYQVRGQFKLYAEDSKIVIRI